MGTGRHFIEESILEGYNTHFSTFPEKMMESFFLLACKNSVENARMTAVNKRA